MESRLSGCRDHSRIMVLTQLFLVISGKYIRTLNNKGEFKYYRDLIIRFFVTHVKIKLDITSLDWGATALIEYVVLSHMSRVYVKYGDCEF
jgi:hypothetical protein